MSILFGVLFRALVEIGYVYRGLRLIKDTKSYGVGVMKGKGLLLIGYWCPGLATCVQYMVGIVISSETLIRIRLSLMLVFTFTHYKETRSTNKLANFCFHLAQACSFKQ
jgi:hypothetical protein